MNNPLSALPKQLRRRPSMRLLTALAGLGGVLAATAGSSAAHAWQPVPASCNTFVQHYLHSARPDGAETEFMVVTGGTDGVDTYAERGSLALHHGGFNGIAHFGPSLTTAGGGGDATQYFNTARETESDDDTSRNDPSSPFSDEQTDLLGLSIEQQPYTQALGVTLTLPSLGNLPVPITVLGCLGDNVLYGTDNAGTSDAAVVVITLRGLFIRR
jgi:hypothetical protein